MRSVLSDWPLPCPEDWDSLVEERWAEPELAKLRGSVDRGRPFGQDAWVIQTARQLGLDSALRGRGRPRTAPIPIQQDIVRPFE
jgi:putative transposase